MSGPAFEPLLLGFGLAGYRSFRDEMRVFTGLGKITLLAGQNNAGKSNVLRFADRFLTPAPAVPDQLDRPSAVDGRLSDSPTRIAVAGRITAEQAEALTGGMEPGRNPYGSLVDLLDDPNLLLGGTPARTQTGGAVGRDPGGVVWLVYKLERLGGNANRVVWALDDRWMGALAASIEERNVHQGVANLVRAIGGTTYSGPGSTVRHLTAILDRLDFLAQLPRVKTIEAFRQIKAGDPADDFTPDGQDLVTALAGLQHPNIDAHRDEKLRRFAEINAFVKEMVGDVDAALEVTGQPEELLVHYRGDVLPLRHLGTGLHQVVIIAAAATLHSRTLLCVEEPEVHLHPLLQRKLVRYLARRTDNQYLIATHSAHMLDHTSARIYHLQPGPAGTDVQRADTSLGIADICYDLGYRPSDLLQSNAVIWVEGPSDRIYLRHWLAAVDDELEEHVHFSIMFYGGGLLSHLTTLDDHVVDDLIRLRNLNRHLAVVIDSDKKTADDGIGATKQRLLDEFNEPGPGLAWVTDGRTVENYVPREILRQVTKKVHPSSSPAYTGKQYDRPLPTKPSPDKIRIAREVCARWTPLEFRWNLRDHVERTAAFVRAANGMPPRGRQAEPTA